MSKKIYSGGCAENERNDNEYWFYNVYHSIKKPMHIIPMSTKVDNTGSIWFMSYKESEHNQNSKDPRTQLFIQTLVQCNSLPFMEKRQYYR
jgi:hypothetical protein